MARWLRALGVHPAAVPAGPAAAAAMFRSVTAASPVAVLADDAADAAQVRGLLPGAGLIVVTSRHQLTGLTARGGARLVRLGPLDAPAAAELAARVIGRPAAEPQSLATLAACCGHLPLAIRAAASRIAARPHLGVEQVTAELSAARHRLNLLDTPTRK